MYSLFTRGWLKIGLSPTRTTRNGSNIHFNNSGMRLFPVQQALELQGDLTRTCSPEPSSNLFYHRRQVSTPTLRPKPKPILLTRTNVCPVSGEKCWRTVTYDVTRAGGIQHLFVGLPPRNFVLNRVRNGDQMPLLPLEIKAETGKPSL